MPQIIGTRARRKLILINETKNLNDLRIPPSNYLEKLMGNRAGQYSITVNSQWRICFIRKNGYFYNVEIVDYH